MTHRQNKTNKKHFFKGLGLGSLMSGLLIQQWWAYKQLKKVDVAISLATETNRGAKDITYSKVVEHETYICRHIVEDGIERISYIPKQRKFKTPIVMQHGMWHGAWCWQKWQELLATWGWESHAHSLPGHGMSFTQRPIRLCTLDYYLSFLRQEMTRYEQKPILIGHSMGGALAQWYLKYVDKELPASILVAPWVSHNMMSLKSVWNLVKLDPLAMLLIAWDWSATPMMRNPYRAAKAMISNQAIINPQELYDKVGSESNLVLYQHTPFFWQPPTNIKTPLLWLAAEKDAVIMEMEQWQSAAYYKADYHVVEGAGHNVMLEFNYQETIEFIHQWFTQHNIV